MPMTTYTGETEIITNLGTTPAERGLETDEFKAKFDEGLKAFVTWFNDTHKTEFDAHLAEKASLTELGHIKIGVGSIDEDGIYTPGRYKVITATRDISLTGVQSITGIGFKPRMLIVMAQVANNFRTSIGLFDGTGEAVIFNDHGNTATAWNNVGTGIIYLRTAPGTESYVLSAAFTSDGCDLTWTKSGTPTGTVTLYLGFWE